MMASDQVLSLRSFALAKFGKSAYVPFLFLSTRGAHPDRPVAWGRNAMDAACCARLFCADERRVTDGEIAWSWRLGAGAKSAAMFAHRADDGGKTADPRGDRV